MTMLDRMRRHKAWLKWSLGAVVVTFVLLYIPSFLGTGTPTSLDVIATVEGREVKAGEFRILYQQQVDSYRQAYGASLNDQLLKQLGIEQRIIQQMVDQEAVLAEAERLGFRVSDAELKERIVRMPGLQENGRFIGDARYRQVLGMQRPPLTPEKFEAQLRDTLVAEKMQAAVTGWVRVSDADVEREYKTKNEKVKLELAVFTSTQFRNSIQPTDADLQAQFTAHTETYKVPEKRRVRFLSIDSQALRAKMTVTDAEIAAKYQSNLQQFSQPEQVRVSHILLKTEGKDDAAVKKAAEAVLAKAKAPGADFGALAKQYSEDGSKDKGGDMDYFGRGAMVKEFEDASWALKPGEITDLVKTQYGYHIIKGTDKRAAATKPLAEVKAQIDDQIRWEKAQAEADKINGEVAPNIKSPADLDKVAQSRGLLVGDSGLFARDEPLAGLGFAPGVASEAFTMTQGAVSGSLRTDRGYAFITLSEIKAPYVPKLEEVKAKVREDVIRLKAVDMAKAKAQVMSQQARGNFAAAAKAAGVDIKTTELITRGTALPEVGTNGLVEQAVFALKKGEVSEPISTDNAVVVAKVVDKQEGTPEGLAAEREALKNQLLQQARQEFFAAYMSKAKAKMTIAYKNDTIKQLIGS
jgi:peptidyl-prolyl cis-trans isomerase D